MTGPRRARREEGSAIVEFVMLGVILLIPLVYLVLTMARVQAGAYAVSMAAREAGRAFVTAADEETAYGRAGAAAAIAFADHGFGPQVSRVSIACSVSPCLTPGAAVHTDARVVVPLPLIPGFVRGVVPLEMPVSATHVSTVDRFRGVR